MHFTLPRRRLAGANVVNDSLNCFKKILLHPHEMFFQSIAISFTFIHAIILSLFSIFLPCGKWTGLGVKGLAFDKFLSLHKLNSYGIKLVGMNAFKVVLCPNSASRISISDSLK